MKLIPTLRLCVALAVCLSTVSFAQSSSIPDEWFYEGTKRSPELKSLEGKPASELDASTWIGEAVKLSDLKGKVVVLDFWATWCGPCMAAIPENVELVEEMKDKPFAFIGIHDSQNGWNDAAKVVKDKKINYPVAKDSGSTSRSYKLQFWPTYVVIDHMGIVRAAGLIPTNVKAVVDMLMKEVPSAGNSAGGGNPDVWYIASAEKRAKWLREAEGKPLPALASAGWIGDTTGGDVLKGKIAVISLLGSGGDLSIAHCRNLQGVSEQYSSAGVKIVGLYRSGTDREAVEAMFEREKFEFQAFVDTPAEPSESIDPTKWHGANAATLGIRLWPVVLIVDRSGSIRVAGAHPSRIGEVLTALLAEPMDSAPESSDAAAAEVGKEEK